MSRSILLVEERELYRILKDALVRLGVTIREQRIEHGSGGFCRLDSEPLIVLSPDLSWSRRIELFLDALRKLDTSGIWLPPAIRDLLEEDRNPPDKSRTDGAGDN